MITTNHQKIYKRCLELKNLFFDNKKRFIHKEIGFNYRYTNLQAALGIAQLKKIKYVKKYKLKIANAYDKCFKLNTFIQTPLQYNNVSKNIYWVYPIMFKYKLKKNIYFLIEVLRRKGIETRPFFYPLHKQPFLKKYNIKFNKKLKNAELICKQGIYLPNGEGLEGKVIKKISKIINNISNDPRYFYTKRKIL
jgi:perosamine synthetase